MDEKEEPLLPTTTAKNIEEEGHNHKKVTPNKYFWQRNKYLVFMFILMCTEWGDPSQISAMGLSAKYGMLSIIVGGGLAQTTSVVVAILLGSCVMRFISERWMNLISGCLFLTFGAREILNVYQGGQ